MITSSPWNPSEKEKQTLTNIEWMALGWLKIAEEIWYIADNCLIYKMPKIAVRTFTDVNKEILIKKQIK